MIERPEIILEGTPEMVFECVREVTDRLNSLGYHYGVRRTSGTPDYAKWDRTYHLALTVFEAREGGEQRIGVMRLQLLPDERTMFRTAEADQRESSFEVFLAYLFGEFQRLGFMYFEEEDER